MSRSARFAAPSPSPEVAEALGALPSELQPGLQALRELIFEVAENVGAAPLQESLKWGQPSYLSARPRESTAVRIGANKDREHVALFFHCQSSVVPEFRAMFPDDFRYDGNRAVLFRPGEDLQKDKLRLCIAHALQYRVD